MNPIEHNFLDGSQGIREEDTESTFVFPVSHKNLSLEVKKWLQPTSCGGCGETEKSLKGGLISDFFFQFHYLNNVFSFFEKCILA